MKERLIKNTRRFVVILAGSVVLLLGIIMVFYPGPGWLVIFAGLAILASELEFAGKILDKVHYRYDRWQAWLMRQNKIIQFGFMTGTGIVVVATAWLLNTFGFVNHYFNLQINWLTSPLIGS